MEPARPGGQMQPYDGGSNGGGRSPAPKKKKKRFSIVRFFGRIILFLFSLCVIGVLTLAIFCKIFLTYVNTTLIPSLDEITLEEMTLSLASTIYYTDANGQDHAMRTLHNSESNRELIEYNDLPKHLVDAIVAIEDHRFWEHKGVDWYGTARATIYSATGQDTQGGSTITQQLVRNITGEKEVTVKRKLKEIFRSLDFDAKNSKEDILTLYLNKVYFGHGFSGIQTAAKGYFGKDVSELDLAESACIVGITNYPSLYDPLWKKEFKQEDGSVKTPRDFNKARQEEVLKRMLDLGWINEGEYTAAKNEKLKFVDTPEYAAEHGLDIAEDPDSGEGGGTADTASVYSWFEDQVINDAIDLIAQARGVTREYATDMLYSGGYHIYTTLDPDIQSIVDSVYQNPENFYYNDALDSAITVMDPYTGYVVAMAGGVGQKDTNRALNLAAAPRQPGSSIKPMSIYAPALEYDAVSPITILDDYPLWVNDSGTGGYPRNSPMRYTGPVTVKEGVQRSINTIAVRTLEALGRSRSYDFMVQNLDMKHFDTRDLAPSPLAMGALTNGVSTEEVAAAYSAFANGGVYTPPRTITRIESNDHTETIADTSNQSKVAMKETTAYLMTSMLENAVNNGTGKEAKISGVHVAGKTGTTSDSCDRYFAGYTPYYAAAVWFGHSGASKKINAGSTNPAAVVWQKVMSQIHADLPAKDFPGKPAGITTATVCGHCGKKPGSLCNDSVSGEVQASWSPEGTCDCHAELRVCTDPATGAAHMAGQYCPAETVSSRIMLKGREFLELPSGGLVMSEDAENHMTYYNSSLGKCPIHDENYVPTDEEEPELPGEDGEGQDPENPDSPDSPSTTTPTPGGPGWPTEPYTPSTTTPSNHTTTPSHSSTTPSQGQTSKPAEPEDPGPATPSSAATEPPVQTTPAEPVTPPAAEDPEPELPPEPVLP